MRTRKIIFKGIVSIVICTLVNALIIGICSDGLKTYNIINDKYTIRTYVSAVVVAFIYIVVFGYWLFYIPALALFHAATNHISHKSHIQFVILGAVVGYSSGIVFLFLTLQLTPVSWYTFPSGHVLATLPAFGVIGAIYGLVYREWLFKDQLKRET